MLDSKGKAGILHQRGAAVRAYDSNRARDAHDHNQILGRWYALYADWSDAPLRGERVRAPEP
eukprot:2809712-Pleurochrysis_carterae.AAC.1